MSAKSIAANVLLLTAGLGAGYAVGYLTTKKRMEKYIDTEIQSVKDAYAPFRKEGIFATPEGAVEALIPGAEPVSDSDELDFDEAAEIITDNEYSNPSIIEKNLWDDNRQVDEDTTSQGEPQADIMAEDISEELDEMPPRNPDKPYVITVGQFMTDDINLDDKISLLYFEEDNTLVDERETIVNNVEEMVGEANLHLFGVGSSDRNAVYIRNEKKECDFEIIRDLRSFTEVVLQIKPVKSGTLRMRDDDD